jgi:hypothetical protein
MVYDYLFYKSYQLAKKSKNWEDTPVLLGIMIVGSGFLFNIFTVKMLVDIIVSNNNSYNVDLGNIKYLIAVALFLLLLFYYTYRERWKIIVAKYEIRENGKNVMHPIFPVLIYLLISLVFIFLVGMYKHNYWIFSK